MNFCPFPHENLSVPPELSLVENFEQPYTTFHNGFTQLRGEDHCYSQNPQTYTDPGDGICKPSIILALLRGSVLPELPELTTREKEDSLLEPPMAVTVLA